MISANVIAHPKQTSIPCTAQENSLIHLGRTVTNNTKQDVQLKQALLTEK